MAEHNEFGKEAESKAAEFLRNSNHRILAQNFRFKKAEIDIIALDQSNDEIAIVEVKARAFGTLVSPEEAVNAKKRKLLIEAANVYLEENQLNSEVRFDILTVLKFHQNQKTVWEFKHIKNAFFAYE